MKKSILFFLEAITIGVIFYSCCKKDYFFVDNAYLNREIKIWAGGWYSIDNGSLDNPDGDSLRGPFDIIKVQSINKLGPPFIDIVYYETNLLEPPKNLCDIDTASLINMKHYLEINYAINADQKIDYISSCE